LPKEATRSKKRPNWLPSETAMMIVIATIDVRAIARMDHSVQPTTEGDG